MSNLSKLVLLINAAVPGALIVVIVLKSNGFTKEAAIVSQSYFPTYVLSIFTLGAWTAIGLSIFQVDEDGNNVCAF
jgi:thiamine transporter ThiT